METNISCHRSLLMWKGRKDIVFNQLQLHVQKVHQNIWIALIDYGRLEWLLGGEEGVHFLVFSGNT